MKKHRHHKWGEWKRVETMAGPRWWRYCTIEDCETHQHKKVYKKRKKRRPVTEVKRNIIL